MGKTFVKSILLIFCLVCVYASSEAAICSLRNPDRDVYLMFPEATNYKAYFNEITPKSREMVESRLKQKLDINDIGTHTFYVIYKDRTPVGFIHARAEWGTYGNVEIIWAFNLDGTLRDYAFQRSREKGTRQASEEGFRKQFVGKKLGDPFVLDGTKEINPALIQPIKSYEKICSVLAYGIHKAFWLNELIFTTIIQEAQKAGNL